MFSILTSILFKFCGFVCGDDLTEIVAFKCCVWTVDNRMTDIQKLVGVQCLSRVHYSNSLTFGVPLQPQATGNGAAGLQFRGVFEPLFMSVAGFFPNVMCFS